MANNKHHTSRHPDAALAQQLHISIADGSLSASPTALDRPRLGLADGSLSASLTALYQRLSISIANGSISIAISYRSASPTATYLQR